MRTILITGISKGLGLKLADSFSIEDSNLVIGCSRTMTTELKNLEKPRDFDPFGQTGFAHLWLQYD